MTIDDPDTLARLTEAFERYENALMANDTQLLDSLFRDGPETVRYGVGENLYGHAAIAAFRRSRPGGAPPRTRTRTAITSFGSDFGVTSTEYLRAGSAVVGRQTQSWVRFAEGWRIVAAHVSQMADFS